MSRITMARRVLKGAYGLYKKLPPKQRKQVLDAVTKHGPALVKKAAKARRGLKK